MTADCAVTAEPGQAQEELREEIDNPIERLKLCSESDAEIARYLDALEVTSPLATAVGVVGVLIAQAASWFILRGAALAT